MEKQYILMDEVNGDIFTEYFETEEEAIKEGQKAFDRLSAYDQKRREAFYILKTVNPDPEAENHFDGNIVKSWK